MNTLKNPKGKSLNSITIYQSPLLARVLVCICPSILYWPIKDFIKNGFSADTLFFLLLMLAGNIFVFYCEFYTYIRLDIKANKLVIREFASAKMVIDLDDISQIEVSTDYAGKSCHKDFIIEVVYNNLFRYAIKSWCAANRGATPLLFSSNERQIKRLRKFCEKCNQYLNSRQK